MDFGSGAEYYGETLPQACWRFYLKRRYSDVAACTDEISTQEQAYHPLRESHGTLTLREFSADDLR